MSTVSSSGPLYNDTDAHFRAWCQHFHDTFALGWVQTSDTGQINLGTVAKPAAGNAKQGYEIWKMADTLQATAPCYVRIDYGSGTIATYPGIWLTIGTGSDGSGNITGKIYDGGGVVAAGLVSSGNATSYTHYGSADTNRITVMLGADSASYHVGFGIERTKDANGDDTATGFLTAGAASYTLQRPFGLTGASSGSYSHLHYTLATGTQTPWATGWSYVLFNENPSAFASDVGVGLPIPMGTVAKQPGTNWAVCRQNDFILGAAPSITIYGSAISFIRTGRSPGVGIGGSSSSDDTAAILMRYD